MSLWTYAHTNKHKIKHSVPLSFIAFQYTWQCKHISYVRLISLDLEAFKLIFLVKGKEKTIFVCVAHWSTVFLSMIVDSYLRGTRKEIVLLRIALKYDNCCTLCTDECLL